MESITVASIGAFIKDVGFPTALVLMTGVALVKIGKFLGPIAQRIGEAHVSLIETLRDNDTKKTGIMEVQAVVLKGNTVFLEEIHDVVVKKAAPRHGDN